MSSRHQTRHDNPKPRPDFVTSPRASKTPQDQGNPGNAGTVVGQIMSDDLVASWCITLSDGPHRIEFEHGTLTGKRVVRVDKKESYRENWMFKLVGSVPFNVNDVRCAIHINAVSGFAYEYELEVNGKSLEKFTHNIQKVVKSWRLPLAGKMYRISFDKNSMDVFVNGQKVETMGEFGDEGTETNFQIPGLENLHSCYIKAVSSGKRQQGIVHSLIVDENEIPEAPIDI